MNLRKLVAVTHNYIGPSVKQSRENTVVQRDGHVAVLISGEHLVATQPLKSHSPLNRLELITTVRDPKIAEQKPDVLLLYIGSSPVTPALEFTALFKGAEVHLVLNRSSVAEVNFKAEMLGRNWPFWPIVHFAESTGNVTMDRLVEEFLTTGSIGSEAVWW